MLGSMEAVWKKVKSAIKQRIPVHSFKMWIEPLKVSQTDKGDWVVNCPNFFSKKRVQGLYGDMIRDALQKSLRQDCRV
jgi:chromosomal replication initiator protein